MAEIERHWVPCARKSDQAAKPEEIVAFERAQIAKRFKSLYPVFGRFKRFLPCRTSSDKGRSGGSPQRTRAQAVRCLLATRCRRCIFSAWSTRLERVIQHQLPPKLVLSSSDPRDLIGLSRVAAAGQSLQPSVAASEHSGAERLPCAG
jgi:hypothetical protein